MGSAAFCYVSVDPAFPWQWSLSALKKAIRFKQKAGRRRKIERICAQLQTHPFDEAAARMYSSARVQLEKDGRLISERNLQVASIALSLKLTVVTHKVKEELTLWIEPEYVPIPHLKAYIVQAAINVGI